ncbi:type I-F CRISPR-associated endoribonuclease Cas6/Csy4 [Vibrio salinus]|uniref:type I-F CRISPR-associated endoribonuclease Cas6/Csy4 n=1 Tax=Vibrio salinus TaxID=2899784 RepID=UPI001E40F3C6|nr:type I-F CRISPR-associated endoribonuclease Cas6/Csy4 [Vibrio salinus]MCE0495794.1 type I-F CRISPR-associated endoribonuclease Cas6/Csy4 [Vibrio salinus]
MKYYQDITLLPDAEVSLGFIWEKVYQQIHLLLVENKTAESQSQLGLSFPMYGDKTFPLGNQLRLVAESEGQLIQANVNQWLQRLNDYVHVKSIKTVPSEVNEYACFYRVNPKSQQRRLKQLDRRVAFLSQKHGVGEEVMRAQLLASIEQSSGESKLPYINVQSLSSSNVEQQHKFMLFIHCEMCSQPKDNGNLFTCYGLSSKEKGKQPVFVPWF